MRVQRPRLFGADLAFVALGAAATLLASYLSVRAGAQISVGALLVAVVFVGALGGFIAYPHWTVAATVVLFALIPTLKVFITPELGALKDLVFLSAASAAVFFYAFERRRPDGLILVLVLLLLGMYVLNVGGGHGIAWAQGIRLVGEPLLLLLVGLTLPEPRRTFRYAMAALIATCCLVAAYGLLQQSVGKYALVEWGYSFESQVRSLASGQLRSFGTLDDPFAYAALLTFGFAAVIFWLRRGPMAWAAAGLILVGLGLSFVRTAALILVAFGGLVLRRWGLNVPAVLVVAATLVIGSIALVNASGTEAKQYQISGAGDAGDAAGAVNVILNGRISAWEAALGDEPDAWLLGRGVGTVGTAAERAAYTVAPVSDEGSADGTQAVDSGYLATIADIGLIGLVVLLVLFGRLITLAFAATRRRGSAGWVALALLSALLLDALTRASFTGFPTAFVGLLLVGVCLAAANDEPDPGPLLPAR